MFSMEDFDNIKDPNQRKEKPEYYQNEQEFINNMMTVTRIIKETDFDTHSGRASFIMHMMNMSMDDSPEINENSIDVINSLSSHIIMLMKVLNGSKDDYLNHFDEMIMHPLIESGPDMPMWED